mmetsp:Transcript_9933/g.11509  ORF Transcript_9933/g.11509 Transcript_9933/m.11509 type:complete len:456 (+) Transcript_9933:148-1515(+)|eukprot:CAMPEP_0197845710 /NCGR_PEP_ID=MMETSP1438-20131217/2604_1 /TAXON_ID=1461541 /ORGANISM="Pterosperma sp., Strain CCMP1384" /LENGTH=455 /DNA_ID=CAMNT_0043457111 /DNA_START=162 /DNA_END=1529 /DNA_ORIENTATION=+
MSAEKHKEAVAFLQKTSDVSGGTVYDHLAGLVGKILEDRPVGAVDLLETSMLIKKTSFSPDDTPVVPPVPQAPKDTAVAVANADLFVTPEPPINPETGEPEEITPPNEFETENILGDASMYTSCGIGFSMTEWYSIMLTLKKLGEDPVKQLKTVRFFGKFFAINGDYFVFEATLKEPPETEAGEEDPNVMPPEAFGEGANAYTYFVCQTMGGPVTKLPDVHPTQITQARLLKKFLTGDLNAEVSAFPPFPGNEANYLRAQISRIASTTVICPVGFFQVGEDEVTLEKAEEYEVPEAATMLETTSWCHRYPHIKAQGRCAWWAPPPPEDDEEYVEPEPEESPALLTSLENDVELYEGCGAWTPIQSSNIASVQYQTVGLRSNLWPGAFAVCQGSTFSNIYIGWGVKNSRLIPPPPPPVCAEWAPAVDEEGNPIPLAESTELPPPPPEPEAEEEEEA